MATSPIQYRLRCHTRTLACFACAEGLSVYTHAYLAIDGLSGLPSDEV